MKCLAVFVVVLLVGFANNARAEPGLLSGLLGFGGNPSAGVGLLGVPNGLITGVGTLVKGLLGGILSTGVNLVDTVINSNPILAPLGGLTHYLLDMIASTLENLLDLVVNVVIAIVDIVVSVVFELLQIVGIFVFGILYSLFIPFLGLALYSLQAILTFFLSAIISIEYIIDFIFGLSDGISGLDVTTLVGLLWSMLTPWATWINNYQTTDPKVRNIMATGGNYIKVLGSGLNSVPLDKYARDPNNKQIPIIFADKLRQMKVQLQPTRDDLLRIGRQESVPLDDIHSDVYAKLDYLKRNKPNFRDIVLKYPQSQGKFPPEFWTKYQPSINPTDKVVVVTASDNTTTTNNNVEPKIVVVNAGIGPDSNDINVDRVSPASKQIHQTGGPDRTDGQHNKHKPNRHIHDRTKPNISPKNSGAPQDDHPDDNNEDDEGDKDIPDDNNDDDAGDNDSDSPDGDDDVEKVNPDGGDDINDNDRDNEHRPNHHTHGRTKPKKSPKNREAHQADIPDDNNEDDAGDNDSDSPDGDDDVEKVNPDGDDDIDIPASKPYKRRPNCHKHGRTKPNKSPDYINVDGDDIERDNEHRPNRHTHSDNDVDNVEPTEGSVKPDIESNIPGRQVGTNEPGYRVVIVKHRCRPNIAYGEEDYEPNVRDNKPKDECSSCAKKNVDAPRKEQPDDDNNDDDWDQWYNTEFDPVDNKNEPNTEDPDFDDYKNTNNFDQPDDAKLVPFNDDVVDESDNLDDPANQLGSTGPDDDTVPTNIPDVQADPNPPSQGPVPGLQCGSINWDIFTVIYPPSTRGLLFPDLNSISDSTPDNIMLGKWKINFDHLISRVSNRRVKKIARAIVTLWRPLVGSTFNADLAVAPKINNNIVRSIRTRLIQLRSLKRPSNRFEQTVYQNLKGVSDNFVVLTNYYLGRRLKFKKIRPEEAQRAMNAIARVLGKYRQNLRFPRTRALPKWRVAFRGPKVTKGYQKYQLGLVSKAINFYDGGSNRNLKRIVFQKPA